MSGENRPLTTKQRVFIAAYLGEAAGNAVPATRAAGNESRQYV